MIWISLDIYIQIYVYRCTPVHAEPSTYACISIRTCIHEDMGCRRPQMGPPMFVCVCASRHPYMPGCTSVDTDPHCTDEHTEPARAHAHAHMRTLPWNLRAHSNIHMHSYVRRCMHVVIPVSWARACAAPDTRAHAHALEWNPHIHPYASTRTHT